MLKAEAELTSQPNLKQQPGHPWTTQHDCMREGGSVALHPEEGDVPAARPKSQRGALQLGEEPGKGRKAREGLSIGGNLVSQSLEGLR